MDDFTDADLWQQVRRGDGDAFGVIYDRHQPRVFGFCRRATGSIGTPVQARYVPHSRSRGRT